MNTALALFIAGLLTIFLPCILPLVPIVLGVSVAGRSPWRPLCTVAGMALSFVAFTFILQVVLSQFVAFAIILQTGTYQILFLFGVGFLIHDKRLSLLLAALSGLFFFSDGWFTVACAAIFGIVAMELGGRVATRIQQFGSTVQGNVRSSFGADSALSAFFIGLTLGLVWVPCAGPALGFAFALVRDEPGLKALALLSCYAAGTAVPLLIIGYGGQRAVQSARALNAWTGRIKQIAGVLLIFSAIALQFRWFENLQVVLSERGYGDFGSKIEELLFQETYESNETEETDDSLVSSVSSISSVSMSKLPILTRAPEFTGLSKWHNSEPFTMAQAKGSVVLVDFWTYSCINCIRTLPYIQGYWEKFGSLKKADGKPAFILIGVHTPEFVFEKSEKNVADAIERHGLTYPVAQDNDFGTWNAFANRYWPAKYLIDAEGYIRYTHFGEGAYEETDEAIASLLKEIGVAGWQEGQEGQEREEGSGPRSPETYMGSRSWPALANAQGDPSDDIVSYAAPATLPLHRYALAGDWQLSDDQEYQAMRSDSGEIRMHFLGGEINLVMGWEGMESIEGKEGEVPKVEVWVDGARVKEFMIDKQDLFDLWKGPSGDHEIILKIRGKGAQGYAFTFGG